MAGAVDACKGEVERLAHLANGLAVEDVIDILGAVEVRLVCPGQLECPGFVALPLAHVICITGVDEDADARLEHGGDASLVVLHPVLGEHGVDVEIARLPGAGTNTQSLADTGRVEEVGGIGHVGAERRNGARDANVIAINASVEHGIEEVVVAIRLRIGTRSGIRLALLDARDAFGCCGFHLLVHRLGDQGAIRVVDGKVGVVLVLDGRICQAVADGEALERDLVLRILLIALENAVRNSRNVVPSVGLTGDEKVVVGEVLMVGKPHGDEVVHVFSHLSLVVIVVGREVTIGEAGAGRLVDKDDARVVVPGERVDCCGTIGIRGARAVFGGQSEHAAAARAACHPENDGIMDRIIAALEPPVEVVLGLVVDREVSGKL
jgi:hypothetical protein